MMNFQSKSHATAVADGGLERGVDCSAKTLSSAGRTTTSRSRSSWFVVAVLLLSIGFNIGSLYQPANAVGADKRATASRQAFLSGSERSEIILREILAVLKRMDGRLERIEHSVTQQK